MRLAALSALALAGCYTGTKDSTLGSQRAAVHVAISRDGVGPITETTKATEETLRALLPGLVVKSKNLGGGSGLVFEVFDGSEQLFYVVPDDAPSDEPAGEAAEDVGEPARQYASTIFAVFAVSPKVAVKGRDWTIGAPLTSVQGATTCECWGEGEVTACFDKGASLRVIFEDRCEDAQERGGKAMIGKKIARVMWKAQADTEPETDYEDRD